MARLTRVGRPPGRSVLLSLLVSLIGGAAHAQSTVATLVGTVVDAHGQVVPGASIAVRSGETGQTREATSDEHGAFRLLGLLPGNQAVRVELDGFEPYAAEVTLPPGEETRVDPMLAPAALRETVTVSARPTVIEAAKTMLGRTVAAAEIDALPVPARNFAQLAMMTPGVVVVPTGQPGASPIMAGGQTGRSNSFLTDGVSADSPYYGNQRGPIPLDAIREFVTLTNGITADYGRASGAVVSVLTRSGTNQLSGRASYYHRDDAWDARPATAGLLSRPPDKTPLEQKTAGGSLGGPISLNRAFFFGAGEFSGMDATFVTTTPLLATYRPNESASVPQLTRIGRAFARADVNRGSGSVTVRYRLSGTRLPGAVSPQLAGKTAPESRYDSESNDQDFSVFHTRSWGGRSLNELRFQYSRRDFRLLPGDYCQLACPVAFEDRPGIKLGASGSNNRVVEGGWQVTDTLSTIRSGPHGEHTLSGGVEATLTRAQLAGINNESGMFFFDTDLPFDAADARTYPLFYSQNVGDPDVRANTFFTALFVQDRWAPRRNLTLNAGVRWDYDTTAGVRSDWNNVAPRIGVAFTPGRTGRTVLRGSYGVYYDQMLLVIVHEYEQSQRIRQLSIRNPGYPDWRGDSPKRFGAAVSVAENTKRLVNLRTPYAEQATGGVQHAFAGLTLTADGVWSRDRNLFETRDLNAPDATGRRADLNYALIRAVESRGRSSYTSLQGSALKRWTGGRTLWIAYTLARMDRDTEDYSFTPQNQRDFDAERAPGNFDVRHALVVSSQLRLPFAMYGGAVFAIRSAQPYTVTTGTDTNRDGTNNDRPAGYARNTERGAAFAQLDLRVSKSFHLHRVRFDVISEAFNVLNRDNWTVYDGVQASATFRRPIDAAIARQIQLGARIEF